MPAHPSRWTHVAIVGAQQPRLRRRSAGDRLRCQGAGAQNEGFAPGVRVSAITPLTPVGLQT
jgi:hypothetical protein